MEPETSNMTVVRSGEVLPVPAAAANVEAHRRAPTLLAGQTPGGQGAVQVWAPQKWRLWLPVAGWGLLATLYLVNAVFAERGAFHQFAQALPCLGYLFLGAAAFRASRSPTYVTTDDAGIGLTGFCQPAEALLWSDIVSVEPLGWAGIGHRFRIRTVGSKEPSIIWLAGYPRALRRRLLGAIVSGAKLEPAPYQWGLYIPSRTRTAAVGPARATRSLPPPER